MQLNPYQPVSERSLPESEPPESLGWAFWSAIGFPLAVLGMFHLTWCIAWFLLGHLPRPSLDDPNSIHGLSVPYFAAGLMFAVSPGVLVLCVGYELVRRPGRWLSVHRLARLLIVLLVWFAAWAYLRWDPLRMIDWYMD